MTSFAISACASRAHSISGLQHQIGKILFIKMYLLVLIIFLFVNLHELLRILPLLRLQTFLAQL